MKRQGLINAAFALLSIALAAYAANATLVAYSRNLSLSAILMFSALACSLAMLSVFYAVMAGVLLLRAVASVQGSTSGAVLHLVGNTQSVPARNIRLLRRFGAQFSENESKPAFVLFAAGGSLWVCPAQHFLNSSAPASGRDG